MESMVELGRQAEKTLMAFMMMLDILDSYTLSRDKNFTLMACIGSHKKQFVGDTLLDIFNATGKWLTSLPKNIWDNRLAN